jgi:chromosome segregation ATPase
MGENKMVGIVLFIFAAASLGLSVWIYTQSESQDVQKATGEVRAVNSTVLDLEKRLHNYGTELVSLKSKHESLAQSFDKLLLDNIDVKRHCDSLEAEVDNLQVYCSKLKDQQIELREKLSNKRPVVQFSSPLVLQVIKGNKKQVQQKTKGAGMGALLNDTPKRKSNATRQ